MLKITTHENHLLLYAAYSDKERIKSLPNRRWIGSATAWRVAATPQTARAIMDEFAPNEIDGDDGWKALVKQAENQDAAQGYKTAENLPQPAIRKNDSWRHQLQAYHFAAAHDASMLAMGMGTGKSKVAIDLIVNKGYRRVLICCPKSVITVWPKEFKKHAGSDNYDVWNKDKGSVAKRTESLAQFFMTSSTTGKQAIAVINYEAAWREPMCDMLMDAGIECIVADEIHRIKSPSGKASAFLSRLGDKTKDKLGLTGTPMPHSPLDLYAQYRFLDKGIFGTSYHAFKNRYAVMGGFQGHQVMGYQKQDELQKKFLSMAYQVGADVLDLPEAMHVVREVELTKETRRHYNDMYREFSVMIGDQQVNAANALSKLLRLQQITSGYLPVSTPLGVVRVGTEKQDELCEVFEDLAVTEPVVVFARFRHDLDEIRRACQKSGRRYAELSGRENDLALWQGGGADVIGVQIQAGGVGIDLTRARYCCYYSVGYSLGDYLQSEARVHRPGQKRPVTYIHLVAKKTVDEQVYDALDKRKQVVEEILKTKIDNY